MHDLEKFAKNSVLNSAFAFRQLRTGKRHMKRADVRGGGPRTMHEWASELMENGVFTGHPTDMPVTSLLPGRAKLPIERRRLERREQQKNDGNGRVARVVATTDNKAGPVFEGFPFQVAQTWRKYPDRPRREADAS
jgi:hypothetical protein